MLTFIKIVVATYFIAINLYGFLLINLQKKQETNASNSFTESSELQNKNSKAEEQKSMPNSENSTTKKQHSKQITDGKLLITGMLGGATGIYVGMFVYKHRLTNLALMVFIPVFIAINVYFLIYGFCNNFWVVTSEI